MKLPRKGKMLFAILPPPTPPPLSLHPTPTQRQIKNNRIFIRLNALECTPN